jgi:hypothetical protein
MPTGDFAGLQPIDRAKLKRGAIGLHFGIAASLHKLKFRRQLRLELQVEVFG